MGQHIDVILSDLIGTLLISPPTRDKLINLYQILPDGYYDDLKPIIQKVLNENKLDELTKLYNHYFEIPSKCKLTSHQSAVVFGHKRPEFMDPILSSLGVEYKPVGNKMPDHIGNLMLIFAITLNQIHNSEEENELKNNVWLFQKFVKEHALNFAKYIQNEVKVCQCDDEINIYKILLNGLPDLINEVRDQVVQVLN